jgi:hypothetical protein
MSRPEIDPWPPWWEVRTLERAILAPFSILPSLGTSVALAEKSPSS